MLAKLLWSKNRNLTSTGLDMVIEAVRLDRQYQIVSRPSEIHLAKCLDSLATFHMSDEREHGHKKAELLWFTGSEEVTGRTAETQSSSLSFCPSILPCNG